MLWGNLRNLVFQCGRKIAFFPGNQKAVEINSYDTKKSDPLCGISVFFHPVSEDRQLYKCWNTANNLL